MVWSLFLCGGCACFLDEYPMAPVSIAELPQQPVTIGPPGGVVVVDLTLIEDEPVPAAARAVEQTLGQSGRFTSTSIASTVEAALNHAARLDLKVMRDIGAQHHARYLLVCRSTTDLSETSYPLTPLLSLCTLGLWAVPTGRLDSSCTTEMRLVDLDRAVQSPSIRGEGKARLPTTFQFGRIVDYYDVPSHRLCEQAVLAAVNQALPKLRTLLERG